MDKEKILSILKDIQPSYDFEQSNDFISDGYLDSFDMVQLVSDLENEFNVSISALDILPENFCSIDAIYALLEKSK